MDLALQSRFYANVPVWLWPFVFAQLLALAVQCDRSGHQEGLINICRVTGRVHVLHLCDDPSAPKPWQPEHVWDYVRPIDRLLTPMSESSRAGGSPWTRTHLADHRQASLYGYPPAQASAEPVLLAGRGPPHL